MSFASTVFAKSAIVVFGALRVVILKSIVNARSKTSVLIIMKQIHLCRRSNLKIIICKAQRLSQ